MKNIINIKEGWHTSQAIAKLTGVTRQNINNLVKRKRIEKVDISPLLGRSKPLYLINYVELKKYLNMEKLNKSLIAHVVWMCSDEYRTYSEVKASVKGLFSVSLSSNEIDYILKNKKTLSLSL